MNKNRILQLGILLMLLTAAVAEGSWTWTWTRKVAFAGLNDPFCVNPLNPNTIYSCAGNNVIVVTRDRGKTWSSHSIIVGGSQIKSIAVNVRDTSVILVAQEGDPVDRVMRSTNNGSNWTPTLTGLFYYFGHPLTYEPSLDDETVYTMISNTVYRSTDFGFTWDSVSASTAFGTANNGWEDAFIRPDSSNILFVADNGTGIWKSYNSGSTWKRVHATTGEIPAMAFNKENPAIAYATRWGGGSGFLKTTDFGETWGQIAQFIGLQTWGVSVSSENPDFVAFGTWGPAFATNGGVYISRDAGASWERTYAGFTTFNNHAVFVVDTSTVLALWGDGIWKMKYPGRINGIVFYDENLNGSKDSSETGLLNWKIRLSGAAVDSTLTDANGAYEFSPLTPGSYAVQVDTPVTWNVVAPAGGSYSGFTVADGELYAGRNFGLTASSVHIREVAEGWNMVSLPVTVPDARRVTIFPSSTSIAYSYGAGGYYNADTLSNGLGYWLKFANDQTIVVGGTVLNADTIDVSAGWNMVGTISSQVMTDSIEQVPPGIVASSFFTFANGAYNPSATLDPLKAYWVKCSLPGVLILQTATRSR